MKQKRSSGIAIRRKRILPQKRIWPQKRPAAGEEKWMLVRECKRHIFVAEGEKMERRNVIIDCDPGIDDSLAIMLALSLEELHVEGITIVCGNSPVEMGAGNARKVLKQMNRLDVPIYLGAEKPLKREYVSALDTHGADGLGESWLPEVPEVKQDMNAVEFLSRTIRERIDDKTGCSVIALGPMTNLAHLIQTDPEAFSMIEDFSE